MRTALDGDTSHDYRIGLIGAGKTARLHAAAIRALPGLRLAAACDPAFGNATGPAADQDAPTFSSADAMVAAGLCDAVHILTPPPTHQTLALQCLDAGLHCFVDPPAAPGSASLAEMAHAADLAGKQLGICNNFISQPGYVRLKALINRGQLGRI